MIANRIVECLLGNGEFRKAHEQNVFWQHHDGCKEWRFLQNTAQDNATVPNFLDPAEAKGRESIIVSAGDVMYVPEGTWHDVIALNERSLHLAVSVIYPTIAEFMTWDLNQDKRGIPSADVKPSSLCDDHAIENCRGICETSQVATDE